MIARYLPLEEDLSLELESYSTNVTKGCSTNLTEGCSTNLTEGCSTNITEGCSTNITEGCSSNFTAKALKKKVYKPKLTNRCQ